MSLESKIQEALKKAMLAKNKEELLTLRSIKSNLLLIKTEKNFSGEVLESQELSMLQKMVKQRRESFSIYEKEGRTDLADKEASEIAVIENFLPKQLSEDEVTLVVSDVISQTGANSMKDMGKVIGIVSQKLAGTAEGATIAKIVKSKLQ